MVLLMSHKYVNFNDAFYNLQLNWASAKTQHGYMLDNFLDAQDSWLAEDYPSAIYHTYWGLLNAYYCFDRLIKFTYGVYDQTPFMESIYWAYKDVEEYKLTWKKICEAWVKDDFEGKEWTIACIDRMRQLMWDKPFNIQWAAKPDTPRE